MSRNSALRINPLPPTLYQDNRIRHDLFQSHTSILLDYELMTGTSIQQMYGLTG